MSNEYTTAEFIPGGDRDIFSEEFFTRRVRCPHCQRVNTYNLCMRKMVVQPFNVLDGMVMPGLTVAAVLTLRLYGWKVLLWALVGAGLIAVVDWVAGRLMWWIARIGRWLREHQSRTRGEMIVRSFTMVLECPNVNCPNPSRKFSVKLPVAIKVDKYNRYDVSVVT